MKLTYTTDSASLKGSIPFANCWIVFCLDSILSRNMSENFKKFFNDALEKKQACINGEILILRQRQHNMKFLMMSFHRVHNYSNILHELVQLYRFSDHPFILLTLKQISMRAYNFKLR